MLKRNQLVLLILMKYCQYSDNRSPEDDRASHEISCILNITEIVEISNLISGVIIQPLSLIFRDSGGN
jgi:hypothetical protein